MAGERDVIRVQQQADGDAAAGPHAKSSARHAVVIGINRYQDPIIRDLRFARADAEAVHAVLTDPELGRFAPENVTLLRDEEATRQRIRSAIGTQLRRRAAEDDTVLIYYAGHGAPENDPRSRSADKLEKYLVPHDADHDDLFATGISMDDIQRFFGRIASKRIVFFIDSCYSGGAGGRTFEHPGYQHRAGLTDEFLEQLAGEGRLVVTACHVDELALEVPEFGHGLFTHYLVEGLRGAADADRDGLVTMGELYDYLCEHVTRHAREKGGSMRPVQKGTVQGRVYLTRYVTEAQKRAHRLDGEARRLFEAGMLDDACALWEEVLRHVPGHEQAQQGVEEVAQRREAARRQREAEERARQQTLQRRQQVLLRHYRARTLPVEEYARGMDLLARDPGAMTEEEREVRHFLDLLTDEHLSVTAYLGSIRLLAPPPREEDALAETLEPDSPPAEASAIEQPPAVTTPPEPEAPAGEGMEEAVAAGDQEPAAPPKEGPARQAREEEPVATGEPEGTAPRIHEPQASAGGLARWIKEPKRLALVAGGIVAAGLLIFALQGGGTSDNGPQRTPPPAEVVSLPTYTNGIGMEFVLIPAGTFKMGSETGYDDEKPVHSVTISEPFYLGRHEVTQEQFREFVDATDYRTEAEQGDGCYVYEDGSWDVKAGASWKNTFEGGVRPVVCISWNDAQAFVRWLNEKEETSQYRLPTEAEWEYAARAGTTGDYAGDLDAMAWYGNNSGGQTHPVGQKQPNAWGLYDMHGNVWEWVADRYGDYPSEAVTDPQGPESGSSRVFRGGGWYNAAGRARSALRNGDLPVSRGGSLGFRLVREGL